MSGTIAPFPKHAFLTNDGDPAVGYKLFCYASGTTTKINSFSDADLTSANANPIILDAAGRATIFLTPGLTYKFVLATPTDTDPPTSPVWTVDGVQSVPTGGSNVDIAGVAGETVTAGALVYLEDGTLGTAGRWYLTSNFTLAESADAPAWGFVLAGAATGAAITVRRGGRLVVAGPLTPGVIYYVSDTGGALETPAPSAEADFEMPYPIAFADSSTSLVFPLSSPPLWTKAGLRTIAFGTGQANAAGSGDTELTNYSVLIPANYLATAGNALVLEGVLTAAANANAKALKIQLASAGTKVTVWSSSANVAAHMVPFRFVITRRTATTASIRGTMEAGVTTAGAPVAYMTYATMGTVAWASNQTLTLFAIGVDANDIVLNDYMVYAVRTQNGAVV
jgi:hypothetical protein